MPEHSLIGDKALLVLNYEMIAADEDSLAVHRAGYAVRHNVFYLGMALLMEKSPLLCLLHYGIGDGVGVVLLKTGCKPQHLSLITTAEGYDLSHPR